jgi:hypothetical protein
MSGDREVGGGGRGEAAASDPGYRLATEGSLAPGRPNISERLHGRPVLAPVPERWDRPVVYATSTAAAASAGRGTSGGGSGSRRNGNRSPLTSQENENAHTATASHQNR